MRHPESRMTRHVIQISEDGERSYWECDCGHGGSCPGYTVDIHAEKHVPEGEQVAYRHPGRSRS